VAVLELYTLRATQGLQLTGPYSRFGWHHPGPIYFYLLAPLYAASGHDPVSLQITALLIALVSTVTLLVVALRCEVRSVGYSAAALISMFVASPGTGFFVNTWNPFVT